MKKRWLVWSAVFGLLFLAVNRAEAVQIAAKGLKGGLVLANMTGDDIDQNKTKIGFALGGYLTLAVSDAFSIQPELLLVQKGTKWKEEGISDVIRLTYLEIPVLAKYRFPAGPDMNAFVFAGPALGLKVGATSHWEEDGDSGTEDFDEAKGLDFGLAFGAGLEKPFGGSVVSFDIRYTLGLGNCCEDDDGEDYKIKNSAILFLVGFGF